RRHRHGARVVLAEAEEVETDLFGHLHGFKRIANCLRGSAVASVCGARRVAECVDAEFERSFGLHSQVHGKERCISGEYSPLEADTGVTLSRARADQRVASLGTPVLETELAAAHARPLPGTRRA